MRMLLFPATLKNHTQTRTQLVSRNYEPLLIFSRFVSYLSVGQPLLVNIRITPKHPEPGRRSSQLFLSIPTKPRPIVQVLYALLFQSRLRGFRGGSPAGSLVPLQFVSRGSYLITLAGRGGNQLCRRQDLASYISIILSFGRLRPP